MNMDLDEPVARRRAEVERLRDGARPSCRWTRTSRRRILSSLDASWWMRGERGRVQVGILLSPEPSPRIQDLTLTSVPDPSAELAAAAAHVVTVIDGAGGVRCRSPLDLAPRRWPSTRIAPPSSARSGPPARASAPVRLGPAIAAAETSATWRLLGDRGEAHPAPGARSGDRRVVRDRAEDDHPGAPEPRRLRPSGPLGLDSGSHGDPALSAPHGALSGHRPAAPHLRGALSSARPPLPRHRQAVRGRPDPGRP